MTSTLRKWVIRANIRNIIEETRVDTDSTLFGVEVRE